MRCDGCQHWIAPDEWEPNKYGFRFCGAMRERWKIEDAAVENAPWPGGRHIVWQTDEKGNDFTEDAAWNAYEQKQIDAIKQERAYVEDGSQYMASMFTAPDFFCAKFTPLSVTPPGSPG
jgi:hypothetical protein